MSSVDPFGFSEDDRSRGSRYHRPLYRAAVLRMLLLAGVYALLAWVSTLLAGGRVDEIGWGGAAALWAIVVVATAGVACFPLALWAGYLHERDWGLSKQTFVGWLVDWLKGELIALVLATTAWTATIGLVRAFPRWWPAPAAAGLAVTVLLLSFVAPVVLEPFFNRFRPLPDERLAHELRELAEHAGVPIRNVLVADASRRTAKANAYVSGLGPTRRVVVWDTLLSRASHDELKLVVAHELGHRRERHVVKGTAVAMTGVFPSVVLLWAVLGTPAPGDLPVAMLLFLGLQLAAAPLLTWISRRWERAADRYSLALTDDPETFLRAHVALTRANLGDLTPPRLAYLMLFTHPTAPERLALAREPRPHERE